MMPGVQTPVPPKKKKSLSPRILGVVCQKQRQRPNIYLIISKSHYTLQQELRESTKKLQIAEYR
jgi:hypothetical protein